MRKVIVLTVLSLAITGWSQARPSGSDKQVHIPTSESDCWGTRWTYAPKYGYIESIEKSRAGDAEAKFCFAWYCSNGRDESKAKIPRDTGKASKNLMESAEAGFGPAEYALALMILRSGQWCDCLGISTSAFPGEDGKECMGLSIGRRLDTHEKISKAVAKAMPYLRRAKDHGVPLTDNYFKRIDLMVRGYEHREHKVAINAELSDVAQKGDAKAVKAAQDRLAALEAEIRLDEELCKRMNAEDEKVREELRKREWQEERDRRRAKEEAEDKRRREEQLRGAGVEKPFMPFNELEKIPYEDCLLRAKEGSAAAYYWLAYYFAEGKMVDKDASAAYKFLSKAIGMKHPAACYTAAQLHELWSIRNEDGDRIQEQVVWDRFPVSGFSWVVPELKGNCCLTNETATSFVVNLYREALRGGMLYATNDIARMEAKISACRERIARADKEGKLKSDSARKALALLENEDGVSKTTKSNEAAERAAEEETARQELARQEYWQGWPKGASSAGSNYVAIAKGIEKKFKVALVDICHDSKWRVGDERSCIKLSASDGYYYEKYDAEGRLVLVSGCRTDFEELKAFDEEREACLKVEREEWAKAKGLTYEEAMSRSNEWKNVSMFRRSQLATRRPGLLGGGLLGGGSLRARRLQRQQEAAVADAKRREEQAAKDAERQAQAEQEKQQREAERAEQRQQLRAIQEELKRVREAKAAAERMANEE